MLPNIDNIGRYAVFLDLDGTLLEIADHPDAVHIDAPTFALLRALREKTQDAVALISGRDIAFIDRLLHPLVLPAAGVHGLQRRNGAGVMQATQACDLAPIAVFLENAIGAEPGVVIERKRGAVALHYRLRPDLERRCAEIVGEAVAARLDLHLLRGKMVFEIMQAGADKGSAIAEFLSEPPFFGRPPIFIGDDVTDEAGFAYVNARDGISIKVKSGDTAARYRVGSVRELLDWLGALAGAPR